MTDTRFCYGATCTWFGPIAAVGALGERALPCCPHCRGVLFEMENEAEWWSGVDRYERDGHPGYRAVQEWQRLHSTCFPTFDKLTAAYERAKL
jgi:hypothetical protein